MTTVARFQGRNRWQRENFNDGYPLDIVSYDSKSHRTDNLSSVFNFLVGAIVSSIETYYSPSHLCTWASETMPREICSFFQLINCCFRLLYLVLKLWDHSVVELMRVWKFKFQSWVCWKGIHFSDTATRRLSLSS